MRWPGQSIFLFHIVDFCIRELVFTCGILLMDMLVVEQAVLS